MIYVPTLVLTQKRSSTNPIISYSKVIDVIIKYLVFVDKIKFFKAKPKYVTTSDPPRLRTGAMLIL
jgi:hypothetical protein